MAESKVSKPVVAKKDQDDVYKAQQAEIERKKAFDR